jgi:hypothetical protein
MAKEAWIVGVEAVVVGLVLALMMWAVTWSSDVALWAFVCGAVFQLGCEVTGVNEWYVKNYY